MPDYWVVGAMFDGGRHDHLAEFLTGGYWQLGTKPHTEKLVKLRDLIRAGDRIAVKRNLGPQSGKIEIRALGIVETGADPVSERVSVRWVERDLRRRVPVMGCIPAINGPIRVGDTKWARWAKAVFRGCERAAPAPRRASD